MKGMTLPLVPKQHHTLQMEQECPASLEAHLGWMPRGPHDGSSIRGVGRGGSLEWAGAGAVTSEGLVQVLLAKDDVKVMHGARVELHPENHITGRAAKLLVVTLQLWRVAGTGRQDKSPGLGKGEPGGPDAQGPPVPWLLPMQGAESKLLTKISPLRSKPGSMVMQMPVWLSPCTLLQRGMVGGRDLWCRAPPELHQPLTPKPSQELCKAQSWPSR